ncbi:hypothetical protein M8J77_011797 [Diaphorina citri]|nr:hypothetical protein M8J77_011797 [Diaphorina citri]
MIIFQVHAPTSNHPLEIIEEFYTQLENEIQTESLKEKSNLLVVMGDYNAVVGKRLAGENHMIGPYSNGTRNQPGELLVNFMSANQLKTVSSYHIKNMNNRWTWNSPKNKKFELDHILVNKSVQVSSCQIEGSLAFQSDHRLLRVSIPLGRRPHIQGSTNQLRIKNHPSHYHQILSKKLEKIDVDISSVQEAYNSLEKTIIEAVQEENKIKSQHGRKRSKKLSQATVDLIEKRETLNRKINKNLQDKIELTEIRKLVRKKIKEDINKYEDETIKEILETSGSTKAIKKELTTTKKGWINNLINKQGKIETHREGIMNIATDFYEELYKSQDKEEMMLYSLCLNKEDEVNMKLLESEIQMVIDSLKKNKAPGPDNISNEMIIYGGDQMTKKIVSIFNRILLEQFIPAQWKTSKIILLHKKGAKNDIKNYRPITLSSVMYKMFAKILQHRLKKILNENQPEEQAGFRPAYSTMDHLHSINQLIEKSNEYNMDIYLALVDFNKAFDSIHQSSIIQGLDEKTEIDKLYVNIVSHLYDQNQARISLETEGRSFSIGRGTKQGCPLSPDFFNNVLETIFRNLDWDNMGVSIDGSTLNNLRFADDVVLVASKKEDLKRMLEDLNKESNKHGLSMNYSKTKILSPNTNMTIEIKNNQIQSETESIYLGQTISFKNRINNEISRRINLSWKKFWALKHIFKNNTLTNQTKAKVLKMCIYPSLLYGCQVWATTKELERKLKTTQLKMMRSAAGLTLADRIRNETIEEDFKLPDIIKEAKKMKWRWAGHVARMNSQRWALKISNWTPYNNKRKRGRKRKRWRDELRKIGVNWQTKARHRKSWEEIMETIGLK